MAFIKKTLCSGANPPDDCILEAYRAKNEEYKSENLTFGILIDYLIYK